MVLKVADVATWDAPLYLAMGQLVVTYNRAEEEIRTLLTKLSADFDSLHNFHARIMTAELGPVGIENALRAIAGDILPSEERGAVLHLVSLYELVRGYRNFYVHGVIEPAVPNVERPEVGGHVATYSAKGALAEHTGVIALAQIHEAVDMARTLRDYAVATTGFVRDRAHDPRPTFAPTPLPDKPPLPPRLAKPRLNLRELFPPPEA